MSQASTQTSTQTSQNNANQKPNQASRAPKGMTGEREPVIELLGLSVEQAIQKIFRAALERKASDLFFLAHEAYVAIEVRALGSMRRLAIVGVDEGKRYVQHIKAQAGMDVANARQPADGRWIYEPQDGKTGKAVASVDLRISTVPTLFGEDLTLRLLVRETGLFQLENLGMTGQQQDTFESWLTSPSGLILCTGPTGSGKTATLYASLNHLNDGKRKINTIEDPIEFHVDGLRQSQINNAVDLHFDGLLRAILRQAPDVIMIGEIRDAETAETAVLAANSGHLVFSTLHAPVASAAIQSMQAYDVHPHFLSTSLRGVVTQRLARTLCPNCKQAFDTDVCDHMFDEVKHMLGPDEGKTFYGPGRCEQCDHTGYAGRTGIFEVMDVTRELRNLIADGATSTAIRDQALKDGMLGFKQAAMLKVAKGQTSAEEVLRTVPREHLLDRN